MAQQPTTPHDPVVVQEWAKNNGFIVVEGIPGYCKFYSQKLDLYLLYTQMEFFYNAAIKRK